jgi:hypothetical protein
MTRELAMRAYMQGQPSLAVTALVKTTVNFYMSPALVLGRHRGKDCRIRALAATSWAVVLTYVFSSGK